MGIQQDFKSSKFKITLYIIFIALTFSNWNYLTGYDFKLGDILTRLLSMDIYLQQEDCQKS